MPIDCLSDRIRMLEHFKIRKTQNADFQFRQLFRARLIILNRIALEVLTAVEFHREARFDAVEVENESGNGNLAAEFESGYLAVAQERPEFSLGVGLVVP